MKKPKSNEIALDSERFTRFCQIMDELLGLNFSEKDKNEVEKRLLSTTLEFGFATSIDFVDWLSGARLTHEQITLVSKHFTVGETYFFRDSTLFSLFEKKILPELILKRQNHGRYIRIWCAACCTGEEPYSLAIILDKLLPTREGWNILILGTDINPIFLKKAEEGLYKKWSFRATPDSIRREYFTQDEQGQFKIVPKIKKLVHFISLNLIEDKYPALDNQSHSMDLIFCNNVLIYFTKEKIKQTIHRLTESLVDNGLLLVSALEVPYVIDDDLFSLQWDSVTVFQKKSHSQKTIVTSVPVNIKSAPNFRQTEVKSDNEKLYFELYEKALYDELIKKLEHSQDRDCEKLTVLLARSFANKGETEKAKICLEQTLHKEKLNPELYFFYSTLLQELDLLPEAVVALKKSLFLDPNYVISYYALGNILLSLGKSREAERNFRNALLLLEKRDNNSFLSELGGITVGRLIEIISSIQKQIYSNT